MKLQPMGFHVPHFVLTSFLSPAATKKDCRAEKTRAASAHSKVSIAKVAKKVADNQVEVVGTVQAVERAEIAAKMTGNISHPSGRSRLKGAAG